MQAASTALSDARALSEKLETALTEARAAVEAKSRFLAVMSHELRTPMNGVGSMVDLLMGTELVDEQREVLSTIDLCARTLHVLVDDILDYSKLEADGVELESIPFDPVAVAEQAARLFEVSAQERGVEVSVELRPGVPRRILGDPHRVRQVLSNLVGNAVKFTEEGSVTLVLARSGERLSATVVDTGVGIPESAQPTLFEPFTQADVSTTRNHGGTGLGLTISRELARLMGGDVSLVESSERGTTFRFDFDFEHAEALPAASEAAPCPARPSGIDDLAGRSILVVEDNPTNRLVAQRLLEKLGVAVTLAEDGAQAIEEVADQPFDLVLMDLMMPNVDGATAARAIRQLDVEWRGLPIIAFTAGAFDEDREVAASAGMCGFLQKPVRLEQLEAVLLEHIDVHGHAA
ncbi:MAG: ATP-binding protein [Planctomycetota bacterium]